MVISICICKFPPSFLMILNELITSSSKKFKYLWISIDTMKQINLKLPENLFNSAQSYVEHFGFRNIQELAAEAIREKIFERNEYDEHFTKEEIDLVDSVISVAVKKKDFVSEKELNKILLG